jgi:hypothetical protein
LIRGGQATAGVRIQRRGFERLFHEVGINHKRRADTAPHHHPEIVGIGYKPFHFDNITTCPWKIA